MGYLRYDYSLAKASVRHGLVYENSATTRPINSWNWFYGTYRVYGEFEVYSPHYPVWTESYVTIRGYFEYNDGGDIDLNNSTVSHMQINDTSTGSYSLSFDNHMTYSDLIEDSNLYNTNTSINGSRYGDTIYAENGDDVIRGGGGNDTIFGGSGQDRAVYSGHKGQYSVGLSSSYQLTISDNLYSEGVDQITGIETIEFGGLSYDVEALRYEALLNAPAQVSNRVSRLFNQPSGKHLFSANQNEIDYLTGGGYGWVNEGTSYLTPSAPTAEVYRFLVSDQNRHFYTANQNERDYIKSFMSNFVYEGVAYNVYSTEDHPANAVAVVRYYNSSLNSHVYSTSAYEQYVLNQDPLWTNEGTAWYGEAAF